MAQLEPRGTGTPSACGGASARGREAAVLPLRRRRPAAAPARWALVALAALLVVGAPAQRAAAAPVLEPSAVADATVGVVPVAAEVEPPPPPAAPDDVAARAARLAALEAAVVAAETAAADLAAAERLTPRKVPVRVPDGDELYVPRAPAGGGSAARLHPDAPPGVVALVREYANGAIPADALCAVPFAPTALLQCDAAEALVELDEAFQEEFGTHLIVNSAYRSYQTQVGLRATKGWLAAAPGTSNHGWGLAVDLGGIGGLGEFDSPAYRWLRANAERFGWHHPRVMQPGGGGPQEPWHWEFATA